MKPFALSLVLTGLTGLTWAAEVSAPPCPVPHVPKVCVPEPTVRKTDKAIYDQKCVEYCLPCCSLASLFGGGCGCAGGGCLNCGRPRTRRALIKKYVHEERPDVKCEVRDQLPCTK